MDDLITFPEGTKARCNRNCDGTFPLPRAIEGMRENDNAYRLRDFSLSHCGHLDCHWVFLSDNPERFLGMPTDEEMEAGFAAAEQEEEDRRAYSIEHGAGA